MRPAWFFKANLLRTTHFFSMCVRYMRCGSFWWSRSTKKCVKNIILYGDLKSFSPQKNLLMSLYLQLWKSNCQTGPWIYIDCISSFGSWTLRTAATNNNFGEFAVNALSIKWILVTKVQSRNLLEKLQQHPQCMMVWLNSTSIVSPAIFSNQVLIYGVLR